MECANEILMSGNDNSAPFVDPKKSRAAMGAFATGVAIVSTRNS
jgi:flavin reductase (DIM6/NTAB) family NADH-FMN oxidoreductase RutF